jgi:hypothetical protein
MIIPKEYQVIGRPAIIRNVPASTVVDFSHGFTVTIMTNAEIAKRDSSPGNGMYAPLASVFFWHHRGSSWDFA